MSSARGKSARLGAGESAITDVIDEKDGHVLVEYPRRMIVWLTISGVAAFVVVGLFGYYGGDLMLLDGLFSRPWPLFLFFCALIFILQGSVLRMPALAGHRQSAFLATGVS